MPPTTRPLRTPAPARPRAPPTAPGRPTPAAVAPGRPRTGPPGRCRPAPAPDPLFLVPAFGPASGASPLPRPRARVGVLPSPYGTQEGSIFPPQATPL